MSEFEETAWFHVFTAQLWVFRWWVGTEASVGVVAEILGWFWHVLYFWSYFLVVQALVIVIYAIVLAYHEYSHASEAEKRGSKVEAILLGIVARGTYFDMKQTPPNEFVKIIYAGFRPIFAAVSLCFLGVLLGIATELSHSFGFFSFIPIFVPLLPSL